MRWVCALMASACGAGAWIDGATDLPYEVHGPTTEIAYAWVLRDGPIVDGDRKAAATRYAFTPRVRVAAAWHDEAGGCACRKTIVAAHVELALGEIYPQWTEGTSIACELSWGEFLHDLRQHELEHVALARDWARTWADELTGLSAVAHARQCPAACAHADEALAGEIAATNTATVEGHSAIQSRLDDHESFDVAPCHQ